MMRCMTNHFLLSGFLSIAQTNDIIFYPKAACDAGIYNGCYNVPKESCCASSLTGILAISISKGPQDFASMFRGGGCVTQVCGAGSTGTYCCHGENSDLTGGSWTSRPRRKRNDSPPPPSTAAPCVQVNFFGYAPDAGVGAGAGAWEIHADDVKGNDTYTFTQLHEEFETIASHEEKMKWLRAHDATYKAQLHDGPVIDIWATNN